MTGLRAALAGMPRDARRRFPPVEGVPIDQFNDEEIAALLNLRLAKDEQFNEKGGKRGVGSLWDEIADELVLLGYPRRKTKSVKARFNNCSRDFKVCRAYGCCIM